MRSMLNSEKIGDNVAVLEMDSSQTPILPCYIIMEEILPRFPVKSLLRFKSVSKHWNCTISTYKFAKLCLRFSTSRDNYFVISINSSLFCEFGYPFHLLAYNEYSSVNDLIGIGVEVATDGFAPFTLVGCCDGLVCFQYQTHGSTCFCVWNPATRECREVGNPGGVNYAWAYCFNYVPSLNDYEIVSSFGRKGDDKWSGFYKFSLSEGKWKGIGGLDEDIGGGILYNSVWVDDTVYWSPFGRVYHIIGLDTVNEELKAYPTTIWEDKIYCWLFLYRLNGCLAMHSFKGDNTSDFWVLKKQDDWSSWEKLFTVSLGNVSFLYLSEHGKCLVRRYDQFRLVDFCKKALERAQGDFIRKDMDITYYRMAKIASYTKSLVSPFRTNDQVRWVGNEDL